MKSKPLVEIPIKYYDERSALTDIATILLARHETQVKQHETQEKTNELLASILEQLTHIQNAATNISNRASSPSQGLYSIQACQNDVCGNGYRLSRAAFDMALERANANPQVQNKLDNPTNWGIPDSR